jgi:hypothetical protein
MPYSVRLSVLIFGWLFHLSGVPLKWWLCEAETQEQQNVWLDALLTVGRDGKGKAEICASLPGSRRNYENCENPQNMLLTAKDLTRCDRTPNPAVENSHGAFFILIRHTTSFTASTGICCGSCLMRETVRHTTYT